MPRNPHLPPLRSLVVFESAARNHGFKRAADELEVTPAAVSQQVKALEAELGIRLFDRLAQGVRLTRAGETLSNAVQRSLAELAGTVEKLVGSERGIVIGATPAVSSLWLTTRLSRYLLRSPGHHGVSQVVSDNPAELRSADLRILYGEPVASHTRMGNERVVLFTDTIAAYASPALAEYLRTADAHQVAKAPHIHLDRPNTGWTTWDEWAAAVGRPAPTNSAMTVDSYNTAIQAAADGLGLVLGWEELIAPHVAANALTLVVDVSMPAPEPFYLEIEATARPESHHLAAFLAEPDAGSAISSAGPAER